MVEAAFSPGTYNARGRLRGFRRVVAAAANVPKVPDWLARFLMPTDADRISGLGRLWRLSM
jgi:hypothetical protein